MKNCLKHLFMLLSLVSMLTSCDLFFLGAPPPTSVSYELMLSFRDANGRDLVQGVELQEWMGGISMEEATSGTLLQERYVLDIILAEPCSNWDNAIYNTPAGPDFWPAVNKPSLGFVRRADGYCYLYSEFRVPRGDCPDERQLTYKLTLPHIFGDDAVHEIVTHWEIPRHKKHKDTHAVCSRIEFLGAELLPTRPDKEKHYCAVVLQLP